MLETKALLQRSDQSRHADCTSSTRKGREREFRGGAHSKAVAKIAMMPAFLFGAICRCHVAHIGSSRFRRSEKMLTALEVTNTMFLLMQWSP